MKNIPSRTVESPANVTADALSRFRYAALAEACNDEEMDIVEVMGRAALELIAQAGFGYTFGVLNGSDTDFSYAVKRIMCVCNCPAFKKPHNR